MIYTYIYIYIYIYEDRTLKYSLIFIFGYVCKSSNWGSSQHELKRWSSRPSSNHFFCAKHDFFSLKTFYQKTCGVSWNTCGNNLQVSKEKKHDENPTDFLLLFYDPHGSDSVGASFQDPFGTRAAILKENWCSDPAVLQEMLLNWVQWW